MSSVTVDRLRLKLRSPLPLAPERVAAWESALGEDAAWGLDDEAAGDGEAWLLIRHLRVAARWRADAADLDVGVQWRGALKQAVQAALAQGDAHNCVRYPHRRAAWADLLYRSALGDRSRQWAWQRMGLIARADVAPERVLEDAAASLLQQPELLWPMLQRIVQAETDNAALTALLRAWSPSVWRRVLNACPQTAAHAAAWDQHSAAEEAGVVNDASAALLAWAARRGAWAWRHRDVLAVLIAALSQPMAQRGAARAGVQAAWSALRRACGEPAATMPAASHEERLPLQRADDAPPLPELAEPVQWLHSDWAGALLWLARLSADDLAPALHPQPLLQALLAAMNVPVGDPIAAVFCGDADQAEDIAPALHEHAAAVVARWERWLAAKAPDLPQPRVQAVCRRRGRVRVEPGWIELHLPLRSVDTRLRRLGLDLDPGWLPWRGCVLKVCYDD